MQTIFIPVNDNQPIGKLMAMQVNLLSAGVRLETENIDSPILGKRWFLGSKLNADPDEILEWLDANKIIYEIEITPSRYSDRQPFGLIDEKYVRNPMKDFIDGDSDLSGAYLKHADFAGDELSGFDLTGADLEGANFKYGKLDSAILSDANLSDALLEDAILENAIGQRTNFAGANLSGADLINAKIHYGDFTNADLSNAELMEAEFLDADFSGADITGANFEDANLDRADFTNAKWDDDTRWPEGFTPLRRNYNVKTQKDTSRKTIEDFKAGDRELAGADLSGADLSGADLRFADLRGAKLNNANLRSASLRKANLSGADLSGADIRTAADLRGAILIDADLTGANLRSVDFEDAMLHSANFTAADLTGATGYRTKAYWNDETIWPDSITPPARRNPSDKTNGDFNMIRNAEKQPDWIQSKYKIVIQPTNGSAFDYMRYTENWQDVLNEYVGLRSLIENGLASSLVLEQQMYIDYHHPHAPKGRNEHLVKNIDLLTTNRRREVTSPNSMLLVAYQNYLSEIDANSDRQYVFPQMM